MNLKKWITLTLLAASVNSLFSMEFLKRQGVESRQRRAIEQIKSLKEQNKILEKSQENPHLTGVEDSEIRQNTGMIESLKEKYQINKEGFLTKKSKFFVDSTFKGLEFGHRFLRYTVKAIQKKHKKNPTLKRVVKKLRNNPLASFMDEVCGHRRTPQSP